MKLQIRLLILLVLVFSCSSYNENVVTKMKVIVPDDYVGYVVVFYGYEKNEGRIEFSNGHHYFYPDQSGVLYTSSRPGEVTDASFLDSKGEEVHQKHYSKLQPFERCIGCWGGRGSLIDSINGKDIVVMFWKVGEMNQLKNMKFLYERDLQDIYYKRKNGSIEYWRP